ncbi:MAG: right-handed parallel beta-helix repeat-containing protein [Gammaproteobacteria bacterium]
MDQGHPDASDDNDGLVLPFMTLQRGLDALLPGDTLLIQSADEPYQSQTPVDGTNVAGFALNISGTQEAPITIVGGQPRPVIDQGQSAAADLPTVGLLLNCVSYVIVRNLEVRFANDAGITSSLSGCATTDLRVESSHVHHVYGYDAVAGVRLANSSSARVRANQIHDIFREDGPATEIAATAAATTGVIVENNAISAADAGVTLRSTGRALADTSIHENRLDNVSAGVYLSSDVSSGGSVGALNVSDNVIAGAGEALRADLDRSGAQSSGLIFRNNTVVDTNNTALLVSGMTEIEVFNNIFADAGADVWVTQATRDPLVTNSVTFSNHNLVWDNTALNWTLNLGGPGAQRFVGLEAWRNAWSLDGHDNLAADPDTQSLRADPQFVDQDGGDYRPQNPALLGAGRNGEDLGPRTDQ